MCDMLHIGSLCEMTDWAGMSDVEDKNAEE
jgi:hypothetical protein